MYSIQETSSFVGIFSTCAVPPVRFKLATRHSQVEHLLPLSHCAPRGICNKNNIVSMAC